MPDAAARTDTDLVSVIIPVRNGVPFVGDAIASVLAQDHPAIEVLVVDDASTDGTGAWVRARFGDRVRVIGLTTQHRLAGARNAGLADARGTFIQFLDADDVLPPGKIRAQLTAFECRPTLAVAVADTAEDVGGLRRRVRPLPDLTTTSMRAALLRGNCLGVHAALSRADAIRAVGGFRRELTRCEDYDLWLRLVDAGAEFTITSEVIVRYPRTVGSLSSNRRAQILANWRVLTDAVRRRPPRDGAERRAVRLHRASLAVRFVMASLF